MKYRAILFDMDGTVLDTLTDLNSAVNHTLRVFGFPEVTREKTAHDLGNGSRRLAQLSLPEGHSGKTLEEFLAVYLPYYGAHANDTTAPYPGILALMERLHAAGLRQAIISNKPHSAVKTLAEVHFPGLLACAVGENEAEGIRRKPQPDMVLVCARELGLDPAECLYVGDTEVDIQTAENAGMDCASVLWGFRSARELTDAGASVLFATPEELGDYILNDTEI